MRPKFILFIFLAWGCSRSEKKEVSNAPSPLSEVLDAKAFKEKLSEDQNAVLLDVRTPAEVAEGIIPGAVVIDFTAPDFAGKISALDKDKDYFVYCKGGGRSAKTASLMETSGFKKIYNLQGGYDGWVENGFETAKPE